MAGDNVISEREHQVGQGSRIYILIVCTLLMMVNCMDRQVIAAVVEPMKADLGLNDGDVGIIGTAFFISIALFAFPISYLVDRWSRRKAMGLMAVFWSLFTAGSGMAWNFWSLFVPRSLVALGESGFAPGGTAMLGAAYSKKARGIVMGVFNMAIPLGFALGSLFGGMMAIRFGWRSPFYIFAVPGIILGILAFFMKDYKNVEPARSAGRRITFGQSLASLFKIRTLIWTYVGYGLCNIMSLSLLFWGPAFIGRAWGVDEQVANSIMVPIVLTAIIGSPVGGALADVWFRRNPRGRLYLPAISVIVSAIFLAIAVYFQFKGPVGMTLVIAYGFIYVMALPCLSAVSQDVAPAAQKGMVWGAMMFCMYIFGGGWGPYMVGAISSALGQDAQALGTALTIASVGGVLGGLCYFMAARPYVADMDKIKNEQLLIEQ
jgi:MFS family permease